MPRQAKPVAFARRFGARVRTLREELKITQEGLAWDCDLTKGFMSEVESGKRLPSAPTMAKFAARLGVEVIDLFANDPASALHRLVDAVRRHDEPGVRAALAKLGFK